MTHSVLTAEHHSLILVLLLQETVAPKKGGTKGYIVNGIVPILVQFCKLAG